MFCEVRKTEAEAQDSLRRGDKGESPHNAGAPKGCILQLKARGNPGPIPSDFKEQRTGHRGWGCMHGEDAGAAAHSQRLGQWGAGGREVSLTVEGPPEQLAFLLFFWTPAGGLLRG